MTRFGAFATVTFAAIAFSADTPAMASGTQPPVLLQCDVIDEAPLCDALSKALQNKTAGRAVKIVNALNDGGDVVRFEVLRRNEHLIAGRLTWHGPGGQDMEGPDLELTVMDRTLTDEMLRSFARELVAATPISL